MPPLKLTRKQILAFRRRVGSLDTRMPLNATSLRRAGWAGLQDSMPRAALLSLHARITGVKAARLAHIRAWEVPHTPRPTCGFWLTGAEIGLSAPLAK